MKPENLEEEGQKDPDLVLLCCISLQRDLEGDWCSGTGPDLRCYGGSAKSAIWTIMQEAKDSYPYVPTWLAPSKYQQQPGLRELPPDPQLAALLEEEEKIDAVVVWFDIYVRDGRGVGVVVCQNSILVRTRRPPPKVEEFSSAGVQPLPRPRFAWLFGLVDRVIHRALIAVSLSCCAAAGAGLYREDASAAAWIVLAVAVDLLLPELRRIWYEFGSDNG